MRLRSNLLLGALLSLLAMKLHKYAKGLEFAGVSPLLFKFSWVSLLVLCVFLPCQNAFAALYDGADADDGVSRSRGLVDPYTGNLSFSTKDVVLAGAVGAYGLELGRQSTSRENGGRKLFGEGHTWIHSWQWELVDGGKNDEGRSLLILREPNGTVQRFTESAQGKWTSVPSVHNTLTSDDSSVRVVRASSSEVHFVRTAGGFRLSKMIDPIGNVYVATWADGRLVQITEPAGRWVKISYRELRAVPGGGSTHEVISQADSSDGQTVTYEYAFPDKQRGPVLTTVNYPDGTQAQYKYTEAKSGTPRLMLSAQDPHANTELRGRVFHYQDETGRLAKITNKSGEVFYQLDEDPVGGPRSFGITLDSGAKVFRKFLPGGNMSEEIDAKGFVEKTDYDSNGQGRRTARIDALGRATTLKNDHAGRMGGVVNPDGSGTNVERDSQGRIVAYTDELGRKTALVRDPRGRVIKTIFPDGVAEEKTYNDYGQVTSRTDRTGAVTSFEYDGSGLLMSIRNALGGTTSFSYDSLGRVKSSKNAWGAVTRYNRDLAGRVTEEIRPDGSTVITKYNTYGQVTETTDGAGAVKKYEYDDYGRPITNVNGKGVYTLLGYAPLGGGAPFKKPVLIESAAQRMTSLKYDSAGRLSEQTFAFGTESQATVSFTYDAAGQQIGITNPLGKTIQKFYDDRGRLVKVTSPLKHSKTTTYNSVGKVVSQTDAKGNAKFYEYDNMGRVVSTKDANGGITSREYDNAGRLISVTDPKSNKYRFTYNLLGRSTGFVYPDGTEERTTFDSGGRKLSFTNRAGAVHTLDYDILGREIGSSWNDGTPATQKAYDQEGRMTMIDNGISKITYAYDEQGRLGSETQDLYPIVTGGTFDPEPRTVRYTYTLEGARNTVQYPDNSIIGYQYNERGLLKEIQNDGKSVVGFRYDSAGNRTQTPRENATETLRTYDAESNVERVIESGTNKVPLSTQNYKYDEVGNRTSETRTDAGAKKTKVSKDYAYDALGQVTEAVSRTTQDANAVEHRESLQFQYDALGNRMQTNSDGQVTLYTVNSLNQYVQIDSFAPAYDRCGNLTAMGEWLYTYDAVGRLIEATNGAVIGKFFYDGKNRCVARRYERVGSAGSISLTLNTFDRWNLIEERHPNGVRKAKYVHGNRADEIVLIQNALGTFYPHHDALGNVTMISDDRGLPVETYSYGVTGGVTIRNATGEVLAQSAVENRWMFTGREWLPEISLYDYRNRVYSTKLGRFLQIDPIRFNAGDLNMFRYVGNRYASQTDPNGLVVIMFGLEFDAVPGVGGEGGIGLYVDTEEPYKSGPYINAGPAAGWNFGLGGGAVVAGSSLEGWGNGFDVNYGAHSALGAFNNEAILGGGYSFGLGGGYSASRTYTAVFSPYNLVFAPVEAGIEIEYAVEVMRNNEPNWTSGDEDLVDERVGGFQTLMNIFSWLWDSFFE